MKVDSTILLFRFGSVGELQTKENAPSDVQKKLHYNLVNEEERKCEIDRNFGSL